MLMLFCPQTDNRHISSSAEAWFPFTLLGNVFYLNMYFRTAVKIKYLEYTIAEVIKD